MTTVLKSIVCVLLTFILAGCTPIPVTDVTFSPRNLQDTSRTIPYTGDLSFWLDQCSHYLVSGVVCDFCSFGDADRVKMRDDLSESGYSGLSFRQELRTITLTLAQLRTYPGDLAAIITVSQPAGKDKVTTRSFPLGWWNPEDNKREGQCIVSKMPEETATAIAGILGVVDSSEEAKLMGSKITKQEEKKELSTLLQQRSQRFFGVLEGSLTEFRGLGAFGPGGPFW